jgi:hypothetical protein
MTRLFSAAFAFDQLRGNIIDLAERAAEFYRWKAPVRLSANKDAPS